jgi:hypothetical protein
MSTLAEPTPVFVHVAVRDATHPLHEAGTQESVNGIGGDIHGHELPMVTPLPGVQLSVMVAKLQPPGCTSNMLSPGSRLPLIPAIGMVHVPPGE